MVAGSAKGRRLVVPNGPTRPTSDRAREALFSSLASLTSFDGARVLDLYAGSGAVGLEAASRGAAAVMLVESDPVALAVIARNVATVGAAGVEVVRSRVEHLARRAVPQPFTIVFADPPYAMPAPELADAITALDEAKWFTPDVVIVVERASADPQWRWPTGFETVRHRRYGEGTLWYGRRS